MALLTTGPPQTADLPQGTTAKERILAATFACFCELGYEKSSMKQIAARAGVSQPLLHHHFDTKERLFRTAISEMATTMFGETERNIAWSSSIEARLTGAMELLYSLFLNNLRVVTFMVEFAAAANHNSSLRAAYLDYRDAQRSRLVDLLNAMIPELSSARAEHSAQLFETVLLGLAMRRPFETDEAAYRQDFVTLAQLLITTLTEPDPAPPTPGTERP